MNLLVIFYLLDNLLPLKNIVDFSSAVLKISNKKDYLTASKGAIEIAKQNTWHFSGQELVRKLELIKQA